MYVRLDSLRSRATAALAVAIAVLAVGGTPVRAQDADLSSIRAEVTRRHDATVQDLQEWIAQPAIAAEGRGFPAGAEYMAQLARDAGFPMVSVVTTDG